MGSHGGKKNPQESTEATLVCTDSASHPPSPADSRRGHVPLKPQHGRVRGDSRTPRGRQQLSRQKAF